MIDIPKCKLFAGNVNKTSDKLLLSGLVSYRISNPFFYPSINKVYIIK